MVMVDGGGDGVDGGEGGGGGESLCVCVLKCATHKGVSPH